SGSTPFRRFADVVLPPCCPPSMRLEGRSQPRESKQLRSQLARLDIGVRRNHILGYRQDPFSHFSLRHNVSTSNPTYTTANPNQYSQGGSNGHATGRLSQVMTTIVPIPKSNQ